jgi:signal transduction histidine kinase
MQETHNDIIAFLLITTLLIVLMGSFIVTILYFYRRRQIIYQKDLEKIKSEFEKNILSAQLEIQEQTFQNISREIHDHVCLNLTLAKLNLVTLEPTNSVQLSERVNTSVEILSKSIHELSDISHGMNSELLTSHGLIKVLENEIEKIERPGLVRIDYFIEGNPVFMDSQKELVIFRIIQEAFNNILKHAKAKKVTLKLYYDDSHIKVTIQDDGTGFIPEQLDENESRKPKSGLLNMKKRANLINGACEITSKTNHGTIIHLSVPY